MTKKDSQLLIPRSHQAKMFDKDNQILLSEMRDIRRLNNETKRKIATLEVSVWVNIFLSFVILLAIAILIINGSNNG